MTLIINIMATTYNNTPDKGEITEFIFLDVSDIEKINAGEQVVCGVGLISWNNADDGLCLIKTGETII